MGVIFYSVSDSEPMASVVASESASVVASDSASVLVVWRGEW